MVHMQAITSALRRRHSGHTVMARQPDGQEALAIMAPFAGAVQDDLVHTADFEDLRMQTHACAYTHS